MQTKSALYQSIQSGEHYVELKATIAGTTYDAHHIKSLSYAGRLYDKFLSIGNCNIRSINIAVNGSGINDGSTLVVYGRLCNATQQSEWLTLGTYIVYEHEQTNDICSIVGYDVLCKTEERYIRTPWDSPTMLTVARDIASQIGTQLTAHAESLIQPDTVLQNTAMSMRDHMCDIATAACANWVTTYDGKLDLVSVVIPSSANIFVQNGDVIRFNAEEVYAAWGGVELSTGTSLYLSSVYLEGGRIMRCYDVSGDQTVADRIKTTLDGSVQFRPYSAEVNLDIALELGDIIVISGTRSQLGQIDVTASGGRLIGTIAAPGEGVEQLTYEDRFYRELSQRTQEISLVVSTKVGNDEIISKINQSPESIQMNASRINFEAAQITIDGISDYDSRVKLQHTSGIGNHTEVTMKPKGYYIATHIQSSDQDYTVNMEDGAIVADWVQSGTTLRHFSSKPEYPQNDVISRSSGATIDYQVVTLLSGMVNVALKLTKTTSTSAGSNIFEGTIDNPFIPDNAQTAVSFYSSSAIAGIIYGDGRIVIRALNTVTISNSIYISWTYPQPGAYV